MKDITRAIKAAISTNVIWAANSFFSVVEKVKKGGYEISFWEGEENWASILVGGKTIGYVWKKYPLIFVISEYADEIKNSLKENDYITFIEARNLVDKEFKIFYDELKEEIDFGLNNDGFSIEDLWFHTNTV